MASIDETLRRANLKRRSFGYGVTQQVLIPANNPSKLDARARGPYCIDQVHTNSSTTLQRKPHLWNVVGNPVLNTMDTRDAYRSDRVPLLLAVCFFFFMRSSMGGLSFANIVSRKPR